MSSAPISEFFYSVIKKPIITEKAFLLAENNKYVFNVTKDATKLNIKKAVSKIFDVTVTKVNIINSKPKLRTFKGRKGKSSAVKKAIVTLKDGDSINITSGVN